MFVCSFQKWLLRLAFVVFGCVFALGLSEIFVRYFRIWVFLDPHNMNWYRPSQVRNVPYLLRNNFKTSWGRGAIITNEIGIRDLHNDIQAVLPIRILAIGDSITFGQGVAQTESYPVFLEELLNKASPDKKYEVINAGIPGFNAKDVAALLPSLMEYYRPTLVIWTGVPNDYDDSFGIDQDGHISFSNVDFVSTSEPLNSWGITNPSLVDPLNASKAMSAEAFAWGEGLNPPKRQTTLLGDWLNSNAALFVWASKRVSNIYQSLQLKSPASIEKGELFSGAYPWPPFSVIYSSPKSTKIFNDALREAASIVQRYESKLIYYNTAVPLDSYWRANNKDYIYCESSAYLHSPFYTFLKQNNLGWDGHMNPLGNRIFAQSILRALNCTSQVMADTDCVVEEKYSKEMNEYWVRYQEETSRIKSSFFDEINFDEYKGITQIIGGVFPPRTFPGSIAKRANFLLRFSGQTKLRIVKTFPRNSISNTRVSFFYSGMELPHTEVKSRGDEDIVVSVPIINEITDSVIEVQLEAVEENSSEVEMRLHRISLE